MEPVAIVHPSGSGEQRFGTSWAQPFYDPQDSNRHADEANPLGRRTPLPTLGRVGEPRFPGTARPVAVDQVETAIFDGEAVLFRQSTGTIHQLGAVAGAVWVSCDGDTTVAAMLDELDELFGLPPADLAERVDEALSRLADEGLLVGFDAPSRPQLEGLAEPASDGSRVITCPPDY